MRQHAPTYNLLVVLKNVSVALLLIVVVMQSVVAYLLAVSLEGQKSNIAMLLDKACYVVSETHEHHVAHIEAKIDQAVVFLKSVIKHDSKKDKSTSIFAYFFFALFYEALPQFHFGIGYVKSSFIPRNDGLPPSFWLQEQPHPPQR